ncbi:MAG: alpha/beta hydrolase [Oscillospiraceae bacterium]|nr:alpha/beta hydrolase [Oscillospiraceae bacterium]
MAIYIMLYALAGLAGLFCLALAGASVYAFRLAFVRRKEPGGEPREEDWEQPARDRERWSGKQAFLAREDIEDVSLRAADGTTLKGWYLPAKEPSDVLVISVHGYRCEGVGEFSCFVDFYHEDRKVNYFLPDLRAHGRSGGRLISFGAKEAPDILAWMDYFIERLGQSCKIALHGISMGASTAVLAAARATQPQLKLLIADCGYTDAYEQCVDSMKGELGFAFTPLVWITAAAFRLRLGVSLRKDTDCLAAVKALKLPALFLHGAQDDFVKTEMGLRLHEACASPSKALLLVEGAGHDMSWYVGRPLYEAKLREWMERFVAPGEAFFTNL